MAKKKNLDARHFRAMEMLLEGTYTMQEIADEVGISRRQLYNWLEWDEFKTAYNNMVINHGKNRLREVMDAMYDAAIDEKSAAAAKLILEAHEILNKKQTQDVNVNVNNNIDLKSIREQLKKMKREKGE